MRLHHRRLSAVVAASAALALSLSACGTGSGDASGDASAAAGTVEIEDNHGTQTVPQPPQSVVVTDNRSFQLLDEWGVEIAGGALPLMSPDISYKTQDGLVDLGSHREPDLEAVVAAEPDLIVNGQRFAQYYGDFEKLAPDAAIVELDPRDDQPFDEELKRQTLTLGEIFDKEDEAQKLVDDFDASIERVKAAYDSDEKVMGVITSGGNINYGAPGTGRGVGPAFSMLGLTPALEVEDASEDHEGDDISVEAIADSNPDWILAMDRDAAVAENSGEEYTPAKDLIGGSEALQNVTAVEEGNIVYMPQYTYVNENIITYTEFFDSIADAMEK